MGISFIAEQHQDVTAAATSRSVTKPTVTTNDVMIGIFSTTGGGTFTPPSGWTQIQLDNGASSNRAWAGYRKVDGTEGAGPYTGTWSVSGKGHSQVLSFRGVNLTTPIDASAANFSSSVSSIAAGCTATGAGDWLLTYAMSRHPFGAAQSITTSDGSDVREYTLDTTSGSGSDIDIGMWQSGRDLTTGAQSRTITNAGGSQSTFDWVSILLKPATPPAVQGRVYRTGLQAPSPAPPPAATGRLYRVGLQTTPPAGGATGRLYTAGMRTPLPADHPGGSGIFVMVAGGLQEVAVYVCINGQVV